jgi:aminoglycoside phosphotransferase (APT) family kinase protein
MPDKPSAELSIDERLVRRLVASQAPGLVDADASVSHVEDGWDCSVWRVGSRYAARLPRRAAAVQLTVNEHRFLDPIGARLTDVGLGSPVPLVHGRPDSDYPWPWSIVPWFDGESGIRVPRAARRGWAGRLAAGLDALHRPADPGYPVNPVRGVPLADRAAVVASRFTDARALDTAPPAQLDALERAWGDALAAPVWDGPALWLHGDPHPGNMIADGGDLLALIDFGDMTAGDPACDLATAWLTFDAAGRDDFRAALGKRVDAATWRRARGWAASLALILLLLSDDNPDYLALGRETAAEVAASTDVS